VDDDFIQQAHETLAAALPGSEPLSERWDIWQAAYTVPASTVWPLLQQTFTSLREHLGPETTLISEPISLVAVEGDGPLAYQSGELRIPRQARLRVDRLYHLAARWGYGGVHTLHAMTARRYAAGTGDIECAVLLNLGPDQVLTQGLPLTLLAEFDLYGTALPKLLQAAGLPDLDSEHLQAIHLAEDALRWSLANAALLLHSEGLRPRAVRRYLSSHMLLSSETADRLLANLADPIQAAHVFAPLIGGPLLQAWLGQEDHTVAMLLTDPPVPSKMLFEVRFAD